MPMPDAASRQRLALLGIDVWVRRDRVTEPADSAVAETSAPSGSVAAGEVRIRMASGSGDWLLVQRDPWSGRHETLVADITAAIGADRCRFGQWAVSESAGVNIGDLGERGIRHVLAFGSPPRTIESDAVHLAPSLDELSADADARRRLWQMLSPLVGR